MEIHSSALDVPALAAVYAGWEDDQQLLITSIQTLTQEQLALRAAPHLRTVGHLVAHIIAARARMIHWMLGEGDSSLDALAVWDGFDLPAPREIRPADDLVRGLAMTQQAIHDALARWPTRDLAVVVEWRYGDEVYTYTRQRMIWNLVRHDYHHGGEVSLTLGVHHLPTPDF